MTMQEKLVDEAMIDRLELKYPGAKDKVSKTSKYFKRNAIASILGTDRKIYELIKNTEEIKCGNLTYLDELVILFRKYIEVADVEKKTLGEVMTPITLVEEMLNTLPSDVWSNPNLKWLDPCAGVGTFPSIVVQRLMKGLEEFESNPIKRYRHIIEEMIFVCELQPKNLFVYHCVFDKDDTNELNTYCGSFLDEKFDKHMSDVWGVEKFDIIIGNPPYQSSKEGQTKTKAIWHLFVNKSLDILIDGGYLNMVHPDSWRNVDGVFKDLQIRMKSNQIIYLEMHDKNDGFKTFGATTTYDFYCLKKTQSENFKTKIKCQDGEVVNVNLTSLEFIPNGRFNDFINLIAKENEEKVNILYSRSSYGNDKKHMSKINEGDFIYPCVYYTYKDFSIQTWYSSTKENGHFGIPKIIFSAGGASTPFIDDKGEYGVMNFACGIVDDVKVFENIQRAMLSERFLSLMSFCDGNSGIGGQRYNRKVIGTFRKDFYKQFLND
jgi:hypothetical protein